MTDPRLQPRSVLSSVPEDDGIGTCYTLSCGHLVVAFMPLAVDLPCSQCVMEYVNENREKKL